MPARGGTTETSSARDMVAISGIRLGIGLLLRGRVPLRVASSCHCFAMRCGCAGSSGGRLWASCFLHEGLREDVITVLVWACLRLVISRPSHAVPEQRACSQSEARPEALAERTH